MRYIDCDAIVYFRKDTQKETMHPSLNDYHSTCNSGLWRDGSFGNALIRLFCKCTDALHVIKNGEEILTITRETPRTAYELG